MFLILFALAANVMRAEETGKIKNETDLSMMFATSIQMELSAEHRIIFPLPPGKSFLTEDNNITAQFGIMLTPMTFNFLANAIWKPIPFAHLAFGSEIGSGWNFDLYGFPMKGMGMYKYNETEEPSEWAEGNGLDGIVWKMHGGIKLLFDLAAFLPGDWNHAVMTIDNSLWYKDYTKAGGTEPWYFKGGVTQNRLSYYFTGFLGYRMPIFLSMTGFMFEMNKPFYNPQSGKKLDYDAEMLCTFLLEFTIGRYFTILALTEIDNSLTHPVTADFNRKWGFSCERFVATWHIK